MASSQAVIAIFERIPKIYTFSPQNFSNAISEFPENYKIAIIFTSYSILTLKNSSGFKAKTSKCKCLDVMTLWTNCIGQLRKKRPTTASYRHTWSNRDLTWNIGRILLYQKIRTSQNPFLFELYGTFWTFRLGMLICQPTNLPKTEPLLNPGVSC